MLVRRLRPPDQKPSRLVVEWQPGPLQSEGLADSSTAEAMLDHVLTACAVELSRHIARWPDEFNAAPEDVQNTLTWFAHRYLPLVNEKPLDHLWLRPGHDKFLDQAELRHRIAELVKALADIELSGGVCVLVGPDNPGNPVQPGLDALLSSLNLFEQSRFVYKLILPAVPGCSLLTASGVERRRLEVFPMRWLDHELIKIVEQRLTLATGGKVVQLSDTCKDKTLPAWLARYGGDLPRGWLEQARPLIAHYLSRGRSLTAKEWREIRKHRPPRLSVNLETGRITVGHREIKDIGQVEMVLLRYLYQYRGRICTRKELYYKAYIPSMYPDRAGQHAYPKEYEGILDTALWRLRKAIEPDPKRPVFVITKRGKGVQLENAW
jgi:DNA-binding winged helix-turn-helix (wHTH) protein